MLIKFNKQVIKKLDLTNRTSCQYLINARCVQNSLYGSIANRSKVYAFSGDSDLRSMYVDSDVFCLSVETE